MNKANANFHSKSFSTVKFLVHNQTESSWRQPGCVFWGVGNFNVTNVRRDRWEGQNLANMELIDENLCAKITTHPSN